MFDFIRKQPLWEAVDKGYLGELDSKISYQLKTAQDLMIYTRLRDATGLRIAEIGGGDSRILRRLGQRNTCFNIECFEGRDQGPKGEIRIENVTNINAYIGAFDSAVPEDAFDVMFSVSVVEHVETNKLDSFHRDMLRALRPNGIFLHAIDLYLEDEPNQYVRERFDLYRGWIDGGAGAVPIEAVRDVALRFKPDMASNPDHILHGWGKVVPSLIGLRTQAQNVSLLVGGRKR